MLLVRYIKYIRIEWAILFLVGILLCTVFFNNAGGHFANQMHPFYQLIALLSIVLCISQKVKISLNVLDISILLLMGFLNLSTIFRTGYSININTSIQLALMGYYVVTRMLQWTPRRIFWYYACSGLLVSLLSIYGFLEWIGWVESDNALYSISGFFSNPGTFGGFLACGVGSFIGLLFYNSLQRIYRGGILLIAVFVVFVIVLSGSRAALIGLTLSGLLYGFQWLKPYIRYPRVFLVLIGLLLLIMVYGIMSLKSSDSVSGRLLIWKINFQLFQDNVWFGIGSRQYNSLYMNYQERYFATGLGSFNEIWLAGNPGFAFNECLQFLVENGCVGGMFVLVLGMIVLRKRKKDQFMPSWIRFSITTFFIIFFVFAQVSYPFHFICFQLLLLNQLAILSSYYRSKVVYGSFSYTSITLFGVCWMILLLVGGYFYKGMVYWQDAYFLQYENPEKSKVLFEKANKFLFRNEYFLYDYGLFLRDIDLRQSTEKLLTCSQYYSQYTLYENLGENYEQLHNVAAAEKMYLKSHYRIPILLTPQYKLMQLYQKIHNIEKMKFWAKAILATPLKVGNNPRAKYIQQEAKRILQ